MSSIGEGQEGGGSAEFRLFGTPKFYWGILPRLKLYIWNPQLENCRLAPS